MTEWLLAVDMLGVAIAAATAATFVAIVGVALFQAWLNRAWLDVRVGALSAKLDWMSHPPRVIAKFQVEVTNRSRRPNSIVEVRLNVVQPSALEISFPGGTYGTRDITLRAGGLSNMPMPVHVPEIVIVTIQVVLLEDDPWIGQVFEGELSVVDMHRKRRRARIKYLLPRLEKEDTP